MPFDWKSLPELANASFHDAASQPVDYPVHLGQFSAELLAARDGDPIVVPLADRAWVHCSGAEAQSFLHNQLTSDINHLSPGHWQHSAWCTAKGRMLASFIVANTETHSEAGVSSRYSLLMASELRAAVAKRFRMYLLRTKATIEEDSELISIGIAGRFASLQSIFSATNLPMPTSTGETTAFPEGWTIRISDTMVVIAVNGRAAAQLFSELSKAARPAGLNAWHWLEIQAGLPLVRQATQEEFVPQMVNFDKLGGVSFHKGCYPGQEIVARTQYLGKVKRHLYRVHSEIPLVPGMTLQVNDADGLHSAGVVANAAVSPNGGFDGLAVILESAIEHPLHPERPDAPPLSSIALVAA